MEDSMQNNDTFHYLFLLAVSSKFLVSFLYYKKFRLTWLPLLYICQRSIVSFVKELLYVVVEEGSDIFLFFGEKYGASSCPGESASAAHLVPAVCVDTRPRFKRTPPPSPHN